MTVTDTVHNCSTQAQAIETVFSTGPGASAVCIADIGAARTWQTTLLPGGRVKQWGNFYTFGTEACTPSDPIIASVVAPDGTVLATTQATWQTGVKP